MALGGGERWCGLCGGCACVPFIFMPQSRRSSKTRLSISYFSHLLSDFHTLLSQAVASISVSVSVSGFVSVSVARHSVCLRPALRGIDNFIWPILNTALKPLMGHVLTGSSGSRHRQLHKSPLRLCPGLNNNFICRQLF